jgi:hypothetical protein
MDMQNLDEQLVGKGPCYKLRTLTVNIKKVETIPSRTCSAGFRKTTSGEQLDESNGMHRLEYHRCTRIMVRRGLEALKRMT